MLIFFLACFRFGIAANSISQLTDQISGSTADETQKKIDELQRQADVYRQIIDIKKKQSETLNSQLAIADSSIQEVQDNYIALDTSTVSVEVIK